MKNVLIAILIASTVGFAVVAMKDSNVWNCAAEDEVMVIDGSCRHVDTLQNPIKCDDIVQYKDWGMSCEIFVRESRKQDVIKNQYVTEEDRI